MSAGRRALWAWALYDLANTTFSLNVISRYLPLIVVQDLGGRDLDVSIAYSASMLLVAASSPVLGALCGRVCGALWALGLALTLVGTRSVLWLVGPITGAALGATWAADRVLMLRLSPPEALGELYGVYGMVGRFSAITGPLLWGAIVYLLEGTGALAYRAAVASLLAMLLAGAFVLAPVEE